VASDGPGKAWLDALGALIRDQRVTAGLSLRELAERTKVSNAYLSQIERGLHEPSEGCWFGSRNGANHSSLNLTRTMPGPV